jgi:hypothetical protein
MIDKWIMSFVMLDWVSAEYWLASQYWILRESIELA